MNTPETRNPLFFLNRNHKKSICLNFFSVESYDGEISLSSQNYFFHAEIRYGTKGIPLYQMKVLERRIKPKN